MMDGNMATITDIGQGEWYAMCSGCGGLIQDQYILRVSPDLSWHAACLKCCECETLLDESQTCFVRDGKPYCKTDYSRLYSARCAACQNIFTKNDFVMRAKTKMFHLQCFRCSYCNRHLVTGDEFALHSTGLFCREHHQLNNRDHKEHNNNLAIKTECQDDLSKESLGLAEGPDADDEEQFCREELASIKSDTDTMRAESPDSSRGDNNRQGRGEDGNTCLPLSGLLGPEEEEADCPLFSPSSSPSCPPVKGRGRGPGKGRSNRGRTVLTEKQRTILTTCFQQNPKPDALLKEQLVEMTGLNARVIRVWFQNRRCKEHKRVKAGVLITRKDQQKIGYGTMNGIPMIAGSPVRQDSPMGVAPVDITGYHTTWQNLSEFARHEGPDHRHPPNFSSMAHIPGYDPQYVPPDMYPSGPPGSFPEAGPPFPGHGRSHPPPTSSSSASNYASDRVGPPFPGDRDGHHNGGVGPLRYLDPPGGPRSRLLDSPGAGATPADYHHPMERLGGPPPPPGGLFPPDIGHHLSNHEHYVGGPEPDPLDSKD